MLRFSPIFFLVCAIFFDQSDSRIAYELRHRSVSNTWKKAKETKILPAASLGVVDNDEGFIVQALRNQSRKIVRISSTATSSESDEAEEDCWEDPDSLADQFAISPVRRPQASEAIGLAAVKKTTIPG